MTQKTNSPADLESNRCRFSLRIVMGRSSYDLTYEEITAVALLKSVFRGVQ